MRILLFVLLFFLTTQCEIKSIDPLDPKWDIADEIYNHEIGKKVFSQLSKMDKNLRVCESGWGLRSKKNIQVMHCGFFHYGELDMDQARELLLTIGNLYLTTINENERIRPFLEVYPFTLDNIEIAIFLKNQAGSRVEEGELCVLTLLKGILEYNICASDLSICYIKLCEERYEEASEKLDTKYQQQSEKSL